MAVYGNLFEVEAINYNLSSLVITSLDFHTNLLDEPIHVQVYTTKGSFRDDSNFNYNFNEWKQVSNATVLGSGKYVSTTIFPEHFESVLISPGAKQSFFIKLNVQNLLCTKPIFFSNEN